MRLWLDEGDNVIGFAWPADEQVDLIVHPHVREIEDEMLEWAEQQRREAHPDLAAPPHLIAWAYESDVARNDLLQRRGYSRTDDFLYNLNRGLDEPIPEPQLPPLYTMRHIWAEADLAERVAVHRDAFAPSPMTATKHRRVMQAPTYLPELDLVVIAVDGTFAAFCIVWLDAVNQIGLFEPLGCHSSHRRRGLGRALLYEGMHRLKALGADTAYVNAGGHDTIATRLYESVGFRVVDRNYAWKKTLHPVKIIRN